MGVSRKAQTERVAAKKEKEEAVRLKKEAEEERARWSELKTKPSREVLERLGVSPETFALGVIHDGKLPPEEQVKTLAQEMAQLKKQLEEERAAATAKQKELEGKRAYETATKAFVDMVESKEEDYRLLLDTYTPDEIVEKAWNVARQAATEGYTYSDKEIADYLVQVEQKRKEAISARRKKTLAPIETASEEIPPERGSPVRPLTNNLAAQSATSGRALTKEERKRLAASMLK